jgi:hypothetical protein
MSGRFPADHEEAERLALPSGNIWQQDGSTPVAPATPVTPATPVDHFPRQSSFLPVAGLPYIPASPSFSDLIETLNLDSSLESGG